MEDVDLKALTDKVELLIQRLQQLEAQNRALVSNERRWHEERLQLIKRNELVQQKVEVMISRLKALEQSS